VADAVRNFNGIKLLFIQDEYDTTETARQWIEKLRLDTVYTCVPEDALEFVYPKARFPKTEFVQTLTGYVPEDPSLDSFRRPMAERDLRIFYRGRDLPHQYGLLGREKYTIGLDVKRLADERGIPVDIAVDSASRIYGNAWYQRLASARATLGTESGSNIFDFDGSLAEKSRELASLPFEEVHGRYLAAHEGPVRMNQISPKIFEAIRVRTALVLFEGTYSGVVQPGRHFIPLKKDYSNISDVFAKLEDIPFLEDLTARAYDEVVASGKYNYKQFVGDFDQHIDAKIKKRARARLTLMPLGHTFGVGSERFDVTRVSNLTSLLSTSPLPPGNTRENIIERSSHFVSEKFEHEIAALKSQLSQQHDQMTKELQSAERERELLTAERNHLEKMLAKPVWFHAVRRIWRMCPENFRTKVLGRFGPPEI
jgi:hypothetical protein